MKIIDLLNKIANGEEVPKKIKYRKCIFEYDEKYKDYFTKDGIIPTTFDTNGIFRNIFLDYNNFLNNEIEIIEEEKKIPEKLETYKDINNDTFLDDLCYKYMPLHKDSLSFNEQVIVDKLNEVLDYLKSKGE